MGNSEDALVFQVQAVTLQLYGKPLRLQESFWMRGQAQMPEEYYNIAVMIKHVPEINQSYVWSKS